MTDDDINAIYYTDIFPEGDCRIRFTMSDNGRRITISTAKKETNNYDKSLSIIREESKVENEASVRFSFIGAKENDEADDTKENDEADDTKKEQKSPIYNITSNF